MNFSPDMARAVLAGRKTETRRPVKPGEDRCRYRPGHDYAVCPGRGQAAVGRIVVVHVERQVLGEVRQEDAIAEGFRGRHPIAAFARKWLDLYDISYRDGLGSASDDEVLERWRSRYGAREVWVIRFIPDPTAETRLLAARSEMGYTRLPAQALTDEPEAVDLWTQAALTRAARERDQERVEAATRTSTEALEEHARRALDDIRAAEGHARALGQPVSEPMRLAARNLRRALDASRDAAMVAPTPDGDGAHTPPGPGCVAEVCPQTGGVP